MNLFNPLIKLKVADYELTAGAEAEITSNQESYSDWAKITITENLHKQMSLKSEDLVDIEIGYEGQYFNVFSGGIASINSNTLLCSDDMKKLERTFITNTFVDCVPQEIISYCLHQAQISSKEISVDNFAVRSSLPVIKQNGIDVFKLLNKLWKINYKFYFDKRVFYWGSKRINEKIYNFAYLENIINLKYENGWVLESVVSPFIKHSDLISIEHPKLTGIMEVKKIKHIFKNGYTRSFIYV